MCTMWVGATRDVGKMLYYLLLRHRPTSCHQTNLQIVHAMFMRMSNRNMLAQNPSSAKDRSTAKTQPSKLLLHSLVRDRSKAFVAACLRPSVKSIALFERAYECLLSSATLMLLGMFLALATLAARLVLPHLLQLVARLSAQASLLRKRAVIFGSSTRLKE